NGHPSGGPWRQLHCTSCDGYFQETHGTPLHGKRVAPEKLVWAVGALAEGLGIRAVARVFEVDPNTVLGCVANFALEVVKGQVPLSVGGIRQPESRTIRPQCGPRFPPRPPAVVS